MKLKLEEQEGRRILSVYDDVGKEHVLVLKAGLVRLIQSGAQSVLLDLTNTLRVSTELVSEISRLREEAKTADVIFLVTSTIENIADFKTNDEAFAKLKALEELANKDDLPTQLDKLKKQKAKLEESIKSKSGPDDIKTLLRQNSNFRKHLKELEQVLRNVVGERKADPMNSPDSALKWKKLEPILQDIFSKEKLI